MAGSILSASLVSLIALAMAPEDSAVSPVPDAEKVSVAVSLPTTTCCNLLCYRVTLTVDDGWMITTPGEYLGWQSTTVELLNLHKQPVKSLVCFPKGKKIHEEFINENYYVVTGQVNVSASTHRWERVRYVRVSYQECSDEVCYPPVIKLVDLHARGSQRQPNNKAVNRSTHSRGN